MAKSRGCLPLFIGNNVGWNPITPFSGIFKISLLNSFDHPKQKIISGDLFFIQLTFSDLFICGHK